MKKLLYIFLLVLCVTLFSGQKAEAKSAEHWGNCATAQRIIFDQHIHNEHHQLIAKFFVLFSRECRTAWSHLDVYAKSGQWETGVYIERSDGKVESSPHSKQRNVETPLLYVPWGQAIRGCPYLVDIVRLREYGHCSGWMKV